MTDKESEWVNGFGKIGGESGSQLWGGGGVGPNCVGYMPLSSQNAYHIIVHSSANYGPHLINPLDIFNFRDRNFVKNRI